MARGGLNSAGQVVLDGLDRLDSLEDFARWLARPADWLGAFDFPFGLPRELVRHLGWPLAWEACMRHYAGRKRQDIRAEFAAFCNARPAGAKFAHRATDGPAGSSSSMKWVNPPVAYMMHAGVPALIEAGVHVPGLFAGNPHNVGAAGFPRRIALEAYPGLAAREVLGRQSYKSDDKRKQTPQRQANRSQLLDALESGGTRFSLAVHLAGSDRETLKTDATGDSLDAVLCLVQAAWGWLQGPPWFGLSPDLDPIEGWIVGA